MLSPPDAALASQPERTAMKLVWITDPHLDFVGELALLTLARDIRAHRPSALLVSGDLSTANLLPKHLTWLRSAVTCPVYLVLGNHDFYGGTFAGVDGLVDTFCAQQAKFYHLGKGEVVQLTKDTALVGHRGWADGRAGSGMKSPVALNDFVLIGDLRGLSKAELFRELAARGDASAAYFRRVLPEAMGKFKQVFVLTHVPPFPQAAWHEGRLSEPDFLPHFCNSAAGEAIAEVARKFPRCRVTVLCGHTHGEGTARMARNLVIHTGGTEYGHPATNRVFTL